MIWDDDKTGEHGVTRDFANSLTLAILVLLICLFLVACADSVGAVAEFMGWVYGL
jgi:hypothetical protein